MRTISKFVIPVVGVFILMSCGVFRDQPTISYPPDGSRFALDQTQCFDVTLDQTDYNDTTIEIRGEELLEGDMTCRDGYNSPATCCASFNAYSTNRYGFNQNCVDGRPCTLVLIARRGDKTDIKTVTVVRYGTATTGTTTSTTSTVGGSLQNLPGR